MTNQEREYTLPSDILAEIEDLPKDRRGVIDWTPEMDQAIIIGWKKASRQYFVRWFRNRYGRGSDSTLAARYRLLTQ